MKLVKKLKYILISFLALFIPIGICTWAISGAIREEQLKAEYIVSPFTEYVLNPINGAVIYDDTTNGSGYLGYDVSSDFTYDNTNKTVELGNPKIDGGISISNTIVFAHTSNSSLNYSQEQFTNSNLFAVDQNNGASTTSDVNAFIENDVFTIKLVSDITIKSNTTLSIGAQIGNLNSSGVSGAAISGSYICLDLNGHNLTIEENAVLNCFGYLIDSKLDKDSKHVGKVICEGTIYTGFVVEDYHGGGSTVGRGFASQMPFSIYSIPYLSCNVLFSNSGKLICDTMLYANGIANKTTLNWIGNTSDYFLQYNEESTITIDTYNPLKKSPDYNELMKSYYYFEGSFVQNNLSLVIPFNEGSVLSITAVIDLAQFSFFIPPYAKIYLRGEGTTFNIGLNFLFMPGAELNCEKGTSLIFSSRGYKTYVEGRVNLGLVDIPVDIDIKENTSYAGIVSLSQLPPCVSTSYNFVKDGVDTSPYSYDYSYFDIYDELEKENISNNKSRININGSIVFESASNNAYTLAGLQSLGDDAVNSISSNINMINTFYKEPYIFGNVNGSSPLVSWVTSDEFPADLYFAGYTNIPLINSNYTYNGIDGLVYSPKSKVYEGFSNYVTFDLLNGYYTDLVSGLYYGFFLDEGTGTSYKSSYKPSINGTFKTVKPLKDERSLLYNGTKYLYYNGALAETDILENDGLGNGLYIQNKDGNYNLVENGLVDYTYQGETLSRVYKAESTISGKYATRIRRQERKIGQGLVDTEITDREGLPDTNSGHLVKEEVNSQNEITSAVNVVNINGDYENNNVDMQKQNVNLTQFSLGDLYSSAFQDSGLKCTLLANGEEILINSGTWTTVSDYETYLNEDQEWTVDEKDWLGRVSKQHKNQWLDLYYFERTATYSVSNFEETDVTLYKLVFSNLSTLKFNDTTCRWTK